MSPQTKTTQKIHFYTESQWEKAKSTFPEALQLQFSAQKNQFCPYFMEDDVFFLIGIGEIKESAELQKITTAFSHQFKEALQVKTTQISGLSSKEDLRNALLGLYKGTYSYQDKETHPFIDKKMEWEFEGLSKDESTELLTEVKAIYHGEKFAMDWLNTPPNLKPPQKLTKALQQEAKDLNFTIKVLDKKQCEKEGLGAFLAVNQASKEAAFTILEYRHPKAKKHIGWVGKCVLFDTGGISIKPSQNMHYMKSDMGGASAVMGAIISIAQLKLPINITAILPITDNIINQEAYLPGDVITAYNGKTIEVLNTDAEGRMTLADGLSYLVKNYKVDSVVDLATLTGSAVRMFGYSCSAYFSNSEEEFQKFQKASTKTQQKIWNMPLWEEWKEEIQSDVADYKNISSKPFGDCIVAATFLEEFIDEHPHWSHLDIAGVAFGNMPYAKDKAATGYGVQLLYEYTLQHV